MRQQRADRPAAVASDGLTIWPIGPSERDELDEALEPDGAERLDCVRLCAVGDVRRDGGERREHPAVEGGRELAGEAEELADARHEAVQPLRRCCDRGRCAGGRERGGSRGRVISHLLLERAEEPLGDALVQLLAARPRAGARARLVPAARVLRVGAGAHEEDGELDEAVGERACHLRGQLEPVERHAERADRGELRDEQRRARHGDHRAGRKAVQRPARPCARRGRRAERARSRDGELAPLRRAVAGLLPGGRSIGIVRIALRCIRRRSLGRSSSLCGVRELGGEGQAVGLEAVELDDVDEPVEVRVLEPGGRDAAAGEEAEVHPRREARAAPGAGTCGDEAREEQVRVEVAVHGQERGERRLGRVRRPQRQQLRDAVVLHVLAPRDLAEQVAEVRPKCVCARACVVRGGGGGKGEGEDGGEGV